MKWTQKDERFLFSVFALAVKGREQADRMKARQGAEDYYAVSDVVQSFSEAIATLISAYTGRVYSYGGFTAVIDDNVSFSAFRKMVEEAPYA